METGCATLLEPDLRRVLAPNPSPMTFTGTNTYILGHGGVCVIDPGPASDAHLAAIEAALVPDERVAAILVTHSHLDHSPLARPLADRHGAELLAAGPSDWGRSALMARLASEGGLGGGEGVDPDFVPDRRLQDGEQIAGDWGNLEVLATPGHMANHLSFAWRGAVFTGDLVMGWSTSLVSPPDGDMGAFMASVTRLSQRADRVYYPGHGDPVADPKARTQALLAHRRAREAQILAALETAGPGDAATLARAIYTDTPEALLPAAARNVLAHLIDLHERNRVTCAAPLTAESRFAPA